MLKYFNNNSYYCWAGERGEIEFGCTIKWVEMPNIKLNISEHKLNEIVNSPTMEQCFDLLHNPGDNDNCTGIISIDKFTNRLHDYGINEI